MSTMLSQRTEPYCCKIGCEAAAEFEIRSVRAIPCAPYVGIAGPDIYSDDTHACEAHVGALLGCQPDAREPEHIYWQVRPLRALVSEGQRAGKADGTPTQRETE